jgi:hypothetical protein
MDCTSGGGWAVGGAGTLAAAAFAWRWWRARRGAAAGPTPAAAPVVRLNGEVRESAARADAERTQTAEEFERVRAELQKLDGEPDAQKRIRAKLELYRKLREEKVPEGTS